MNVLLDVITSMGKLILNILAVVVIASSIIGAINLLRKKSKQNYYKVLSQIDPVNTKNINEKYLFKKNEVVKYVIREEKRLEENKTHGISETYMDNRKMTIGNHIAEYSIIKMNGGRKEYVNGKYVRFNSIISEEHYIFVFKINKKYIIRNGTKKIVHEHDLIDSISEENLIINE